MITTVEQSVTTTTTADLFERYAAAWADHDVDRIMAMHGADSEFHLHDGRPRCTGHEAVRAAFEEIFELFPDIRMDQVRLTISGDLVAFEYMVVATPRGAASPISFEVADIIEVGDGLVQRKDTYLDSAALGAPRSRRGGQTAHRACPGFGPLGRVSVYLRCRRATPDRHTCRPRRAVSLGRVRLVLHSDTRTPHLHVGRWPAAPVAIATP